MAACNIFVQQKYLSTYVFTVFYFENFSMAPY